MAIKRFAGDKFSGLSSDTKPSNILAGATFFETDTSKVFMYDGSSWNEVGYSVSGHNHAAGDITSGTFADARIAESNVTQHEGAIDHNNLTNYVSNEHIDHTTVSISSGTGLSGGGDISASRTLSLDAGISDLNDAAYPVALANRQVMVYDGVTDNQWENRALEAADIQSGTFADARIAESNVTQHEAAITITESQISDFGTYQPTSEKGQANGYASLNGSGKVPTTQLPAIAITETDVVADITARDALTVEEGDVAIVEDASADADVDSGSATYIYDGTDWQLMQQPDDVVTSVNGETGAVVLNTDDIAEGSTNLYYTQSRFDTDFGNKSTDDLSEGASNLYYTDERVDDRVNNLLVGGTNVTLSYDDANNSLTINATAGSSVAGNDHDIQYNNAGTQAGDDNFEWDDGNSIQRTAGYQRVEESAAAIPTPANNQTDKYLTTETVGSDLVIRVLQKLGNGDEVIHASYVAPGAG